MALLSFINAVAALSNTEICGFAEFLTFLSTSMAIWKHRSTHDNIFHTNCYGSPNRTERQTDHTGAVEPGFEVITLFSCT